MSNQNSIATPFFTVAALIAVLFSGLFVGRVEKPIVRIDNTLSLYPNIETVGVALSGINLPKTAELMYRQSNGANWHPGHPLVRIDDGRLIGSLFGLSQATSYDVKVLIETAEITGSVTTQPDELQFTPSAVLHVNDDASAGGDGSAAAPFQTIQEAVNHAVPGTQVLVADGLYHEAVTFPASGNADQWIQVKAEGSGAILDGSETLTGKIWTSHPSKAHVWFTKIGHSFGYLARDGQRFFRYDDLSGLIQTRGHGNVTINEGWYYDPFSLRLYVRSLDDPSQHSWQVPNLNYVFEVNGRDWIWIEGFEMRFYGKTTSGCGVCTLNASHVVVRKNKIHNMQLGIFINWNGSEIQGNDTRIEDNEIYDPLVNEVPWKAAKGSSMEGTAIVIRGHIGAIVRNNEVHNYFNGIYTGSSAANAIENPAVAFDADIYNNRIHDISDDGLEPEGTCVNQRFRNNTIDKVLIGVSLAPITWGPVWVMRSTFTNFTSSPIKWASNSDGIVLFYHNTSWTNATNLNGMSMITPVHNAVMRNNIFQGSRYAFEEPFTGSTGHDWNNDDWYTTLSAPHFKWENINYNTIKQLCTATGLECTGYEDPPGLTNPKGGDFTLLPSSPNIDRGILLPGINDNFKGNAPDVGAFEFALEPSPKVSSIVRADASPTNATSVNFTVTFSEPVTGVDVAAPFSDFGLVVSSGITGASITGVGPVSETTYTVGVNTGSGNGTIRLDLM
ncbi:MAG TPA: right-handed parallel beta-helix repeat-containing protein, partial [Anaerolineales bacterium]|nr:right-handed parallel beta-helix repeat-containing protein [Anaerolineales bacterium]